ncbi:MAG TPA: PH domain-containing protein [Jatrophihabitans sp.]|nr:PH domain-containing protein [Jatrophihabitans sp.]
MPALLPSELPVRARTRHHWIVLFRRPHRVLLIALLVLLLMALVAPDPMAWVLVVVIASIGFFRWHTWRAEWVVLSSLRIIRVQGVPETTSSEASLRLDRISGARVVQTVPGKILGYATIELEAPGEHPDVRRLRRIANPDTFYLELRRLIFADGHGPDPDEEPPHEHITEPLPFLPTDRDRFGRRRHWHNDY